VQPEQIVGVGIAAHPALGRAVAASSAHAARILGLPKNVALSETVVDAHAAVAGAGVAPPSTVVMLLRERSSCHLLMNSRVDATVSGVVRLGENGILPGYFGYEIVDPPSDVLRLAATCGRATMEATAFRMRQTFEAMSLAGIPVRRFVACGDIPGRCPQLMQIFADVFGAKIKLAASEDPIALGAAILGCIAAGPEQTGHSSMSQAIHAMAGQRSDLVYRPDLRARREYDRLFETHRSTEA
jgi:ribulose kinase